MLEARVRVVQPVHLILVLALLAGVLTGGCVGKVDPAAASGSLHIETLSLPSVTANKPYRATLVAGGGTAPYVWTIISGQLPAGLALAPQTGILAGTTTKTGSFQVSIGVSDSSKTVETALQPFKMTVSSSGEPADLEISTTILPAATATQSYTAQLSANGGTAPYHWAISAGTLPAGLKLDASSGLIAGTPTVAGSVSIGVKLTDSAKTVEITSKNFNLVVNKPSAGQPPTGDPKSAATFYGSGLGSDGLSNITIGPMGNAASYRFRANHTGNIAALHLYLIVDKEGYSGGNGGQLKVDLETDDGSATHNPSGTSLASFLITSPQTAPPPKQNFPIIKFANLPAVVEGNLYHVVFTNPDPNPTVNFVSIDDLWQSAPRTPVQPTLSDMDFATLLRATGMGWTQLKTHTPILQVDFTDGTTMGNGYMEAWVGDPKPVGGANSVRQSFKVSGGSITVNKVAVRVARTAGTDALQVRLEDADGNQIEQGAASIPALQPSTKPAYSWITFTFSMARTLNDKSSYNLVLEAPSGTTYQVFPIRKGSAQEFASNTFFPDGYAQFKQGTSWVGWDQWNQPNRQDGDLQFYFVAVP